MSMVPIPFDEGRPLSVEGGPAGQIFVTAASTIDSATWFSVFRLEPDAPGRAGYRGP
jgi:hypothetical protein